MSVFRVPGTKAGLSVVILCLSLVLGAGSTAGAQEYALGDIPLDPEVYQRYLKVYPESMRESLPSAYDARDEGIVTSAKNQGGCGSCRAFASVGAMESHILAAGGALYNLSEQQQNSCNTSMSGCCGGSSSAPRFWESTGPITEACGPYGDSGTGCPTNSSVSCSSMSACTELPYRVTGWHTVSSADFKTSCYEEGPSYWRFTVYSDFSSYWSGGSPGEVYVNAAGSSVSGGHAVLIIGWDDAKGAYLLKNSWGSTAGPNDDGTFWVAYSGHANSLSFGMSNFNLSMLCEDNDSDGYGYPADPACPHPEEDCDDSDPDVNPGAWEGPDGDQVCFDTVDNDCDGVADLDDPGCIPCEDLDGDGYGDPAGENCTYPETDCDDTNTAVNPGMTEGPHGEATCSDGWDNDCDGSVDTLDSGCLYPLFEPVAYYAGGTEPVAVTSADLNGDNVPDLALADAQEDRVSVLLGNGDGTFQTAVFYEVGFQPVSVAAGDLNGDGFAGLVTANEENDTVSVLLGNGDGTFQVDSDPNVPGRPASVEIADLNGDEILDLAVACTGYAGEAGNVSVLLGEGGGSFLGPVPYGTGYGSMDVAVGDLDGDGAPDLVVANEENDNVSVLMGHGDGTFQVDSDPNVPGRPSSVRIAHLDGDGFLDLVVSCEGYTGETGQVSVLLGNGNGSFQTLVPYPTGQDSASVAVGLLTQEADPDLVAANRGDDRILVLEGAGDGTFQTGRAVDVGDGPASLVVDDFNLDGAEDIAVANQYGGTVSVVLNALGGPCNDLDGDGYGDPPGVLCPHLLWDCDDTDPGTYPDAPEMCDGRDNSCEGDVDEEPGASASCGNELFCDGEEYCAGGVCQAGTPVNCVDDGIGCTEESCDEDTQGCLSVPNDSLCDDGLWCNGAETCDAVNDCQAGTPPDCDDGVGCTEDSCDETGDACVNTMDHDSCDDGLWCNGVEFCHPVSDCQAGPPVWCDDGKACTDDACDEGTDTCEFACVASAPDDPCCQDPACSETPVCVGTVCTDGDDDGYSLEGGDCGPVDCDDSDPAVNPGAAEVCDGLGIDEDCDGLTDAEDPDCNPDYPPSSHAMAFGTRSFMATGMFNQAVFLLFPFGAFVFLRFLNRRK